MIQVDPAVVWWELERQLFAVLGMVTARGEARTVGIVYTVRDGKIYIGTGVDTWKAHHVAANPHVSLTIPVPKRVPLLPWIKVPAATITFSGVAVVHPAATVDPGVLHAVFGKLRDRTRLESLVILEVEPQGEFVTYGIGVPLLRMRHPEQARGRAPVRIPPPPTV